MKGGLRVQPARFWSRVGQWIRSPRRRASGGALVAGRPLDPRVDVSPEGEQPCGESDGTLLRRLNPVDRLEQAYGRVLDLVESIRTHSEFQQQQLRRVNSSLDRLAELMEKAPDALAAHGQSLAHIQQQLDAGIGSVKALQQGLSQLPSLADAQRETMVGVSRQLEVLRQLHDREDKTLASCQTVLQEVGQAFSSSTETIKRIHLDAVNREDEVARVLDRQSRRLMQMSIAVSVLAVLAVILGLVALWTRS